MLQNAKSLNWGNIICAGLSYASFIQVVKLFELILAVLQEKIIDHLFALGCGEKPQSLHYRSTKSKSETAKHAATRAETEHAPLFVACPGDWLLPDPVFNNYQLRSQNNNDQRQNKFDLQKREKGLDGKFGGERSEYAQRPNWRLPKWQSAQ